MFGDESQLTGTQTCPFFKFLSKKSVYPKSLTGRTGSSLE